MMQSAAWLITMRRFLIFYVYRVWIRKERKVYEKQKEKGTHAGLSLYIAMNGKNRMWKDDYQK